MDATNLLGVRRTKTVHHSTENGPAVTIKADQLCLAHLLRAHDGAQPVAGAPARHP